MSGAPRPPPGELAQRSFDRSATKSEAVQPGCIGRRFRSGARAPRRPRSGRCGGRSYPTSAASGSGFRSGARAPCRPRSGRCGGRSYPTSAASGSGFRSGARAPCRPRSGRCGGRSYPTSAASGSGFRSGARAPCRPRSGRCGGRSYPTSAASGSGMPRDYRERAPKRAPRPLGAARRGHGPLPGPWPGCRGQTGAGVCSRRQAPRTPGRGIRSA